MGGPVCNTNLAFGKTHRTNKPTQIDVTSSKLPIIIVKILITVERLIIVQDQDKEFPLFASFVLLYLFRPVLIELLKR